ncbi:MAG: SBBP repeat-containing protein, partial [Chloroflexi bacterium]|nr:SBBP repeat-containing protein [Chloroflexota bacterium]
LQPVYRGGTLFGGLDGFVAKLDPSGAALVYATYLGGSGDEACFGIAVNAAGQAHVSGPTSSSDFPTESAYQADFAGGKNSLGLPADGFVAKLDPNGAALVYATYLGGSGGEYLNPVSDFARIAVDASDNAYVTSSTSSADFPTTANAFQPTYGDNSDAYVAKLNPAGGLVYATYLGGSGAERGLGLAVDASGSAYVAGYTGSEDFPIVDGLQSRFAGGGDGFIARLDPGGSALLFSTYLGGSDDDRCKDIALDKEGNVYVIGDTRSSDFPTTENAFQSSPAEEGRENVFVVKMGAPNTAVTEEYTAVFPQSFSLEQNFPTPSMPAR